VLNGLRLLAGHAFLLAILVATAYVAGRLVLRAAGRGVEPGISGRAALASALGLLVLATGGALLGFAGALNRTWLFVFAASIHAAGRGIWRELAREGVPSPRRRWVSLAAAVAALPGFVLAIYPPTAFDETLYHLPFARAFAGTGSLPFLPELRFPVFPNLAEVLQAELLLFGGDIAAHQVSLLATGLTAALLWTWGGQWIPAPHGRLAGGLAAALWLGNPIVTYLSGTGYVEPLLALFVTAGTYVFWSWRRAEPRGAPGHPRHGWLALSGLLIGAAAGTKYIGLFFVASLAAATLAARPRSLPIFLAAALVAMAAWYGRILFWTGNPLFPYFSGIFGAHDWTPVRFHDLSLPARASEGLEGIGRGLRRLATLPWDIVFRRERVGGLPPFSPAYLLGAPILLMAAIRDRAARSFLLPVAVFLLLFPALPADARYLIAILPLASLGLAVACVRLWPFAAREPRRGARLLPVLCVLCVALPGWLYAFHRFAVLGPLPADAASRELYLRRTLPAYPALARVNGLVLPGDVVYGLRAESMRAHSRGEFLGDHYGPHRFALLEAGVEGRPPEAAAIVSRLRSWSVDYLIVARESPVAELLAGGDAGLETIFEDPAARAYVLRPGPREREGREGGV
jgi:4-amino-4-deoxy-L-arabinose transferase-like glycosyltransferase